MKASLLDETRFMNTPEGIEEFAESLTATRDMVKAVLESTGNLWIQVHDRLMEHGIPVALHEPSQQPPYLRFPAED